MISANNAEDCHEHSNLAPIHKWGGVALLKPAVEALARLYGNINVIGAICPPGLAFTGIQTLDKSELKTMDFDLIIVTGSDVNMTLTNQPSLLVSILKDAAALGIDVDKIVPDRVICVPNFTLEKYIRLRHSALSIFSRNCCGGLFYHRFGLPFLSPTINMFTSDADFMNFLKDPMQNVRAEVKFLRTEFEKNLKFDYPVFQIGNTEWHMNHYRDANVAFRKWYERSFRINWFNLLIITQTTNPEILAEFDRLPFAKKVCFVPFKTNLDSGFYLDIDKYDNNEIHTLANRLAEGSIVAYDIWDMLLYGRKTVLT